MKSFLILISLFFLKTHVCFSALDYQEVAQYTRSSQISFSGQRVDFSDVHSDMAVIESVHHSALSNSDKGKNVCLVRLTPVYELTTNSLVTYERGITHREENTVHSTQREAVFFSSFDPSSDLKGKTNIGNFYFCNSKVEHEDDHGRCFCSVYRWAGSLHLLRDELDRKRYTQLSISAKWCHELKVADKISSLNATVDTLEQSITTLPGINPFSLGGDLPLYLTKITDSLQRGCKETGSRDDILNLACSEQNAFNYMKGVSVEPLSIKYLKKVTDGATPNPQRILKSIVFHMHTTKHPCHMCGFSACIEFLERTPEYLTLKDELLRNGIISPDFRIVVLCSYRYTYELKDHSELPNLAAIAYTDHLDFDNPLNFERIGLFRLRQRFVTDL